MRASFSELAQYSSVIDCDATVTLNIGTCSTILPGLMILQNWHLLLSSRHGFKLCAHSNFKPMHGPRHGTNALGHKAWFWDNLGLTVWTMLLSKRYVCVYYNPLLLLSFFRQRQICKPPRLTSTSSPTMTSFRVQRGKKRDSPGKWGKEHHTGGIIMITSNPNGPNLQGGGGVTRHMTGYVTVVVINVFL